MKRSQFIGMRYVTVGESQIPVVLRRNENGSVAGQCLLGESERPILDAPSEEAVLALIEDVLEMLLLSRGAGPR